MGPGNTVTTKKCPKCGGVIYRAGTVRVPDTNNQLSVLYKCIKCDYVGSGN
jgi:predicted RNA-binding Zn-ribbon protein involved in translation (DUF1610 family)